MKYCNRKITRAILEQSRGEVVLEISHSLGDESDSCSSAACLVGWYCLCAWLAGSLVDWLVSACLSACLLGLSRQRCTSSHHPGNMLGVNPCLSDTPSHPPPPLCRGLAPFLPDTHKHARTHAHTPLTLYLFSNTPGPRSSFSSGSQW